ncbi:MAG TPA: hypothetical protein VGM24_02020 [Puia sp.]
MPARPGMKVMYQNASSAEKKKPFQDWLREARSLEDDETAEQAIAAYEKIRRAYPLKEESYDRLMVLYRKTKRYKEEIKLIGEAISIFETRYGTLKKKVKGKIATLSKALLNTTGLADKKGRPLYQMQPVGRWQKRKLLLQEKLKKATG